jgi:hypothetical protein
MKRVRQTFKDIFDSLMPVESSWLDEHGEAVICQLRAIPERKHCTTNDVKLLLDQDFSVGQTVVRLFLDLSKDEFQMQLKESLPGAGGSGVMRYRADHNAYIAALNRMGLVKSMTAALSRQLHWSDLLVERLKSGRGSAIKGQQRGRGMEDFVEVILRRVFDTEQVTSRCRFVGANGLSTEKTVFAIPSTEDPHILIEVKAYGATGSKQTDVLGDVSRIVDQKRNDTDFFLVTDGITWKERPNDLRKLVSLQNEGKIKMIYTKLMAPQLEADLHALKQHYGL